MAEQQITFKPVLLRASGTPFENIPTKENPRSNSVSSGISEVTFVTDSFLSSAAANQFSYTKTGSTPSSNSKSSGLPGDTKYYFEVDVVSTQGVQSQYQAIMFGLAAADYTGGYDGPGARFIYPATDPSRMYPPGANYANCRFTTGDTIMVAYDGNTREVWFGVNGIWGEDPASASSYTIGGASGDQVAIVFGSGTGGTITMSGTVIMGDSLTYSVPAGFQGFSSSSTSGSSGGDTGGTTPSSSTEITFEADAYLTSPSTNTFSYTRAASTYTNGSSSSAPLRSDGKYYFEVDVTGLSRTAVFIGLGLYGVDGGEVTTDFKWLYGYNGNIFPPNAGYLGAGFIAGSTTLMFAYDALTREVWFGANGTWGENPTAASSYTIGGSSGDNVALIFGSGTSRSLSFQGTVKLDTDLTYTVPSGFSSH